MAGTWSPSALVSNGTDLCDVEHWGLSTDIHGQPRVCIRKGILITFRFLQATSCMFKSMLSSHSSAGMYVHVHMCLLLG